MILGSVKARGRDSGSGLPQSQNFLRVRKKYFPLRESIFPTPQHRFLAGKEEYVIPAQRSIRIFEKRFIHHGEILLLVEVGGNTW